MLFSHVAASLRTGGLGPGAWALLSYLIILIGLDLLTKRESERGGGAYGTSPLLMVPLVEFGKLVVSLALHARSLWRVPTKTAGGDEQQTTLGQPTGIAWTGAAEVA